MGRRPNRQNQIQRCNYCSFEAKSLELQIEFVILKIAFGVLAQQSKKERILVNILQLGGEILVHVTFEILDKVCSVCYFNDHAISFEDSATNMSYEIDFMRNVLRDEPTSFRLACVAHHLDMKALLDSCINDLSMKTHNKELNEI
ncbi:hypothetical protein E3N88_03908 [Mikania micrantha]|uniref:Uncharacterized protein n=1 Tax=Mikania micrantha TaxID=192012 RepID=A0A5N6PVR2_9ASTR|nr:hypothetical protein E3N88_03908 [Mikania micrantha]